MTVLKKWMFYHASFIEKESGSRSHWRVGRFPRLFKIKVLEIRGTTVKLGFDVDPDVPVHRAEVWERVHASDDPIAGILPS